MGNWAYNPILWCPHNSIYDWLAGCKRTLYTTTTAIITLKHLLDNSKIAWWMNWLVFFALKEIVMKLIKYDIL